MEILLFINRYEPQKGYSCLLSNRPKCTGRCLQLGDIDNGSETANFLKGTLSGKRQDPEDNDFKSFAGSYCNLELERKKMESPRRRCRGTSWPRDFRRVVEMAASAFFLGIVLLVTPGKHKTFHCHSLFNVT